MAILNYTTSISADKSVGEIQKMLAQHGARSIMTDWEEGEISSLTFNIALPGGNFAFRLPVDANGVYAALQAEQRKGRLPGLSASKITRDHARRVAWRILKDWLEAQLALIQSKQATLEQVMFPHLLNADGQTIYAQFAATKFQAALPEGKGAK